LKNSRASFGLILQAVQQISSRFQVSARPHAKTHGFMKKLSGGGAEVERIAGWD
jgi:hypothetical protein